MKRANGEGSVYKSNGLWRAACRGGRPSFQGKTREEAIRRRSEYLRKNHYILVLPKRARDSVAVLLSRWLDARRDKLRPRTIESYHDTATRFIIPAIGDLPIGRLTPQDVMAAMDRGNSPRAKNYIRTVLHLALAYAVDAELIVRNVAAKVPPLKVPKKLIEMPSQNQWQALRDAIDAEPIANRAFLLVFALCGLRESELCGLAWSDYTVATITTSSQDEIRIGEFVIQRQLDRDGNLSPVKTDAGNRRVPVPPEVVDALELWRKEQDSIRSKRRWPHPQDAIFTTRNGTLLGQRNVLRVVHRVTKKAGIGRKSVHYLRHLAISHLVSDPEVDIKTIQSIAGHSSIRVTLDTYGHLIPGGLVKAALSMNRRRAGGAEKLPVATPS